MRLIVTSEERFAQTPHAGIWTRGACSHQFWTRYLDVFDEVIVAARISDADDLSETWRRADGRGVRFWRLPHYLGPSGFATQYFALKRSLADALSSPDAVLFRSPSPIAAIAQRTMERKRPFAVEIVGDPHDAFAPRALTHPARPLVRWFLTSHLVQQCRSASAVSYVTNGFLQTRYPAAPDAFTTSYSSIDLGDDAFVDAPRTLLNGTPIRLISVGSMDAQYKGFDVLIDALREVIDRGLAAELVLVGDGRFKPTYEQYASQRGLRDKVIFRGHLQAGNAVRQELDGADLFVLASKSEGLPRAMIEAMARSLPCVGTQVGGIPELLAPAGVVPPNDPASLAAAIIRVLSNRNRFREDSARNLAKAREYRNFILAARRRDLYNHLHTETERWRAAASLARVSGDYVFPPIRG